jgi:site-specific DNA-methyltransferase (adenine-specific)
MKTNVLYYGDNLHILRDYIPDESVDLIYLDPPFNSSRSYNVLFKEETGVASAAQIEAFEDTWNWAGAAASYDEVMRGANQQVARILRALVEGLGHNELTAYLTMMAIRLLELHQVLKPTGSLYLHCDPTASHYLKVVMDAVFGPTNFRNEVIWKRANAHNDPKRFGRISDTILYYSKGKVRTWNTKHTKYRDAYYQSHYKLDEHGRYFRTVPLDAPRHGDGSPALLYEWHGKWPAKSRTWAIRREIMEDYERKGLLRYTKTGTPTLLQFADEMPGVPLQNIWTDIPPVNPQAKERLGYPTQKPLELLERIIETSSNPGDVVLDPFCGCGTAVHAAQKLGRQWIGIDITYLAIGLIRRRMLDAFPKLDIEEIGVPVDLPGARELAHHDKYQFQWWALDRIDAQPVAGKKKGADKGIDGVIPFLATSDQQYKRAIVSVKGGEHVTVAVIRDLVGVLQRENEPIGILLTLNKPTKDMVTEAASAGFYESELWQRKYPRVQILTIEDVLNGKRPDVPWGAAPFAKAPKETQEKGEQETLL